MAYRYYGPAWEVAAIARLKPIQRLVLLAVVERANKHGSCFPGQQTLAKDCGLSEKSVRTSLKALEGQGLIRRCPRWRADGGGRSSDSIQLLFKAKAAPSSGNGQTGNPGAIQPARPTGEPPIEPEGNEEQRPREYQGRAAPGSETLDNLHDLPLERERRLLAACQALVDQGDAEWVEEPQDAQVRDYAGSTPRG